MQMLSDVATIELRPELFTEAETVLARYAGLTASAYRYPGGVLGLRIRNELGHISTLPFQGQQIWDAEFFGRPLVMRSIFEHPVDTQDFVCTYGAFFLHCGATAMGDPGPDDRHPVHGELPNARYQKARLLIGHDEIGPFMALTGSYHHRVAFAHHYVAEPTITLRGNSSRIGVDMRIRNLKQSPMELMYLAHINFRPIERSVIIDTVPAGRIRVRPPTEPSDQHRKLHEALEKDPACHKAIDPNLPIDPDIVMSLDTVAGDDGWAHAMQLLPDGTADFVSHRPDQLDHAVRWMTQTPELSALGLMLPATAEADGYLVEKAKGNVRLVPALSEFRCSVEFGALDAAGAAVMRDRIETILQKHQASSARQ
jgi:hypothetical protein